MPARENQRETFEKQRLMQVEISVWVVGMCAGRDRVGCVCVWKWKDRERDGGTEYVSGSCSAVVLSTLHRCVSLPLSVSLCKPVSMHECMRAYVCVWAELISLATQLEGTLSHAEHNAEKTAERLPVAFLLYARMIWIQQDVMVKEARRIWYHDILWKCAELGKRYLHVCFFSVILNSDIQMGCIGLKFELAHPQKELGGIMFSRYKR